MLTKKSKKTPFWFIIIVFIMIFYVSLRIMSLVEKNNGIFEFSLVEQTLNQVLRIDFDIILNTKTITSSLFIAIFGLAFYETFRLQQKRNIQEETFGSADWKTPKDIKNKKDKKFENNIILTKTEQISKNMRKSKMNRHIILVGRPGTRKIKKFF